MAWREAIDFPALDAVGVRSILIEPGIVYGYGQGIPNVITTDVVDDAIRLVGDGTQHWGTVHVDDLADLYLLALDGATAGSVHLGVNGHNPTVRELGEAASHARGLDGRVATESQEETIARLGAFGQALLVNQQATGEKARRELGWTPTRPTLTEEIAAGTYTA